MSIHLRLAGGLLVVALAAACNATAPSPTPTAGPTGTQRATPVPTPEGSTDSSPSGEPSGSAGTDEETTYRLIEEAVVPLRELEPRQDVDPQVLDEEELREHVEGLFNEDNPPEVVEATQVLYRALGLLDDDDSLRDLYLELLTDQIAGLYDPEVDELFVVSRSGGLGVLERVTYAHEYTHALQDQHFDLDRFDLGETGQGDRNQAVLSLIEGDATAVMSYWAQRELSQEELLELLQRSLDPSASEVLERMPPILRETLTFPYERGLQLVLGLQTAGGWDAVNEAYDDPPISTEQVLHPEKYEAREAPIDVELPADLAARMGDGWESGLEDTFGESQFQIWLRNALGQSDEGNEAAAGWGGDRFAVLHGPDDAWVVAMATEWDTAADAAEFETAATEALGDAGGDGRVLPGEGGTVRWVVVASDDETLARAAGVLGLAG